MNVAEAIAYLKKQVSDTSGGLPEELFLYISGLTPLVNVDLLIKDEKGRTLLSWRNDLYEEHGWHVPGGIVRFKEALETRVQRVAETEIGVPIIFEKTPIAFNQLILNDYNARGHFLSFLYKCSLPSSFVPENKGLSNQDAGYLAWHDVCPANLLKVQEMYRKYI